MNMKFSFLATLGTLLAACIVAAAPIEIAAVKHEGDVDFEREILPILRKNCLACHNSTEAESNLILETPAAIAKGGELGPSVVANKSAESLLLKVASHQDDPIMPPEDNGVGAKNLSPQELGLIKLWIDQGARGTVLGASGPISWQPLPPGVNPIYAVAVSPDGQWAAAGRSNQIYTFHVPSKKETGRLTDPALLESGVYSKPGVAHLDLVQALAFSPDGKRLASGGFRNVKIWKRVGSSKKMDVAGLAAVKSTAVTPDGKMAAFGEESGKIKLVDLSNGKTVREFAGHSAAVSGLTFSADGATLISGSQDKTFRVWTVADGKETGKLETPAPVNAVALVTEGKEVVTGHADNKIMVWAIPGPEAAAEKAEGAEAAEPIKPLRELAGHSGPITSLVAIAGGTQIVSGSKDGTVRIWTAANGAAVRSMNHGGPVEAIAVRADGARIASASSNNSGKLWDAANGAQVAELKGDLDAQLKVADLTREVALAKKHVDLNKKDLDAANKRKTAEEENQKKAMENLKKTEEDFKKKEEAAKKPEADLMAAQKKLDEAKAAEAKADEALKPVAEAATKAAEALKKAQDELNAKKDAGEEEKKKLEEAVARATEEKKKADEAKTAADKVLADAKKVVSTDQNAFNKINGTAKKPIDERNAADRAFKAAQRSVDRAAKLVKKATDEVPVVDKTVKDAEAVQKTQEAALSEAQKAATELEKPLAAIAFSADGGTLVTGGESPLVHTWDSETGKAIGSIPAAAAITALTYSAGNMLISVAANNSTSVWDAKVGWELERVIGSSENDEAFPDRVISLAFSWDGKLLATGSGEPSRSGQLKLWDAESGKLVREIAEPHSDTIFQVEFSRDNKFIATCAADRFAKIFDVASGEFVRSFEGHTHHVLGVSWSDDGRTVYTAGADNVCKIWDARTGDQKTSRATGFKKEVTSIRAIGNDFAISCGDNNVYIRRGSDGNNLRTFSGGTDFMFSVGVSADGQTIAAGGQDSVLRLWNATNGQVVATFAPPQPEQTADAGGE